MAHTPSQSTGKKALGTLLSVAFWVVVWAVVARLMGNEILLAGPAQTAEAFVRVLSQSAFWVTVASTTARVLIVGAGSALAGVLLGAASARWMPVRQVLAPVLQLAKSAPIACVIVIVLVAWGSAGALVVVVAFVAMPPFYVATLEAHGARPVQTNRVLELAGVSTVRRLLTCAWPAALPFYVAAAKTAVALSWRAAITAELLSLPLHSIGAGVYSAKLTLDSAELFVWTIVVMLLSFVTEHLVVALLRSLRSLSHLALAGQKPSAVSVEPEEAVLELVNVSKSYGEQAVLESVNLSVKPGERLLLNEPTGSGKSTQLLILAGLEQPDAGTAVAPCSVGLVLQTPTLVEDFTALENVQLVAPANYAPADVALALTALLPDGALHKRACELSGGTRRLVELARALFSPGQVIILDEPFTGLDAQAYERAQSFIDEHLGERPLIIASHL